jgi:hypothetical protein
LGLNTGKISEEIKKYIEQNQISLLNAFEEISLIFVDGQQQNGDK